MAKKVKVQVYGPNDLLIQTPLRHGKVKWLQDHGYQVVRKTPTFNLSADQLVNSDIQKMMDKFDDDLTKLGKNIAWTLDEDFFAALEQAALQFLIDKGLWDGREASRPDVSSIRKGLKFYAKYKDVIGRD